MRSFLQTIESIVMIAQGPLKRIYFCLAVLGKIQHSQKDQTVCRPKPPREGKRNIDASSIPTRSVPSEAKHSPFICSRSANELQPHFNLDLGKRRGHQIISPGFRPWTCFQAGNRPLQHVDWQAFSLLAHFLLL